MEDRQASAARRADRIFQLYSQMGGHYSAASSTETSVNAKKAEARRGVCRICFEVDQLDRLVQPCDCRGTLENVHLGCLDQWRRDGVGNIVHSTCNLCSSLYVDFQLFDDDDGVDFSAWETLRSCWAIALCVIVCVGIPYLAVQGLDNDALRESYSNLREFYAGLVFPSLGRLGWSSTQLALSFFALIYLAVMTLVLAAGGPQAVRRFAQQHFHSVHMPNFPSLPSFPARPHFPNFVHAQTLDALHANVLYSYFSLPPLNPPSPQ